MTNHLYIIGTLKVVEQDGVEPSMPFNAGFTVRWGYQFSYYSKDRWQASRPVFSGRR